HTIERMLRALGEYHVGGIKTNIPLFRVILNDPAFRRGELHTGYLDALLKTPLEWNPPPGPGLTAIAALVASKQIASKQIKVEQAEHVRDSNSRWVAAGREGLFR